MPFGTSPFQPGPVSRKLPAFCPVVREPGLLKMVIHRSIIGNKKRLPMSGWLKTYGSFRSSLASEYSVSAFGAETPR
jgi:hypothetical protein